MSSTAPAARKTGDRRWLALGLIAAAQFMVIMDTSIVGVALPEMQQDLGFDPQNLSWVFNAYVVAFRRSPAPRRPPVRPARGSPHLQHRLGDPRRRFTGRRPG